MANKCKVMLTTSFLTGGGAERVLSVWASKLSDRGYDASILVNGRVNSFINNER